MVISVVPNIQSKVLDHKDPTIKAVYTPQETVYNIGAIYQNAPGQALL